MSHRVLVCDRLRSVARELEASAAYAVLWEDGKWNWTEPVHVLRDRDPAHSPRSRLVTFQELASRCKMEGTAIEMSPGCHALLVPMQIKRVVIAVGFLVVQADDRLAYYMLRVANLLLQNYDDTFTPDDPAAQ